MTSFCQITGCLNEANYEVVTPNYNIKGHCCVSFIVKVCKKHLANFFTGKSLHVVLERTAKR